MPYAIIFGGRGGQYLGRDEQRHGLFELNFMTPEPVQLFHSKPEAMGYAQRCQPSAGLVICVDDIRHYVPKTAQ